ncbi:MAG: SpoIIE family protein phosphatase [Deltaproteobacteria bacterium]|nr:SpoIIE family protein phosphatase [Deltaproteobacteria bacterium]
MDDIMGMAIVAVDDSQPFLTLINGLLRNYGYTTIKSFSSSIHAFDHVQENPPDLLLLDLMMPELDGIEFCRKVKSNQATRHVPVIMITSNRDEQTLSACFEAGAIDFIGKPFGPAELLARVKSALFLKRSHDLLKNQFAEIQILSRQSQRDLDQAERIFTNIIRRDIPEAPNVKFMISPAKNVSGDILLVTSTPTGVQHILLGDFTGHGLSAAIGATTVSSVFKAMSAKGRHIKDIMSEINNQMRLVLPTGLFFCACLIALDCIKGKTWVLNCGLPDVLVIGRQGGLKRRFPAKTTPPGLAPADYHYATTERMVVKDGDHIYVYSDGLTEANNPQGEMFSQTLVEKALTGVSDADQGFAAIQNDLQVFRGTAEQKDDITLADIRCDVKSPPYPGNTKYQAIQHGSSDWQVTVNLTPPRLANRNIAVVLYEMLEQCEPSLARHRTDICLILSELYNNALEHGLLGLDSRLKATAGGFYTYYEEFRNGLSALDQGWIKIDVLCYSRNQYGRLDIRVEDSGPGFDYHQDICLIPGGTTFCGRGVALVHSLCQELVYQAPGNKVEAVYVWSDQSAEAEAAPGPLTAPDVQL